MGSDGTIPAASRTAVRVRARHRCERCGVPSPNGHWHHRRSRRVRERHRHCPCNGVWLCATSHQQVHGGQKGVNARDNGFVVTQWAKQPGMIPVNTYLGKMFLDCDGGFTLEA